MYLFIAVWAPGACFVLRFTGASQCKDGPLVGPGGGFGLA